MLIIPLVKSYTGIGIATFIYSFGLGAWFVTLPLLLTEYHGADKLAFTYGIMKMLQGISSFISPQVSGKYFVLFLQYFLISPRNNFTIKLFTQNHLEKTKTSCYLKIGME